MGQSSEDGETNVSKLSDLVDHEEHAAKCQLPNHSESGRVSDDRYGVKRAKLHKFFDFSKFSGPDFINITVRYQMHYCEDLTLYQITGNA